MTAKPQDAKCCGNKPVLNRKDELGHCVVEIYSDGGDWVVYRNDKGVRVWTKNDHDIASEALAQIGVDLAKVERNVYFFDERPPKTSGSQDGGRWERQRRRVCALLVCLQSQRRNAQRWEQQRQSVYALVARSLTLRLTGHAEQAAIVIKIAERLVSKFIWRTNIGSYLAGAASATLVFLLAAALYFHGREWAGADFYSIFVFATLGGFLSVLSGVRGLLPDLHGQHILNFLSGAIRIAIAVISGLLMYLAIKGSVLPLAEGASDGGRPFRLWFLLAVAGFVEKLVPEMLGREAERRTEQ